MSNKVRFGLSNLHIAFFAQESQDDAPKWDVPIKIPGIVGFTPSSNATEYSFRADNMAYYSSYSGGNYKGDIEVALFPDEVIAKMLGWILDENGGLIETANGKASKFALIAQVEGDERSRRFVYYNGVGSPPSTEYKTMGENIDISPEKMTLSFNPVALGGKFSDGSERIVTKYAIERDPSKSGSVTIYDSFFDAVYVPPED